jgi:hypothetical protein
VEFYTPDGGPGGKPELALDRLLPLLPAIYADIGASAPAIWLDPTLHPFVVRTEGDYGVTLEYPSNNCDDWTTFSQNRESVVGILSEAAGDIRLSPVIREASQDYGGCGLGFNIQALFPYLVCVAE